MSTEQPESSNHTPLTREGQYLLSSWKEFQENQKTSNRQEKIAVSEVFGFVARVYEKARAAVEYKGEHVLRRAAIERALNRIFWLPKDYSDKAELLIQELTWSRFLRNDTIPKAKVSEVAAIIAKYDYLLGQTVHYQTLPSLDIDWEKWLIGVASTEIEECLSPSFLRSIMAPLMFAWLKKRFEWDNEALSPDDREIQLFLAAHRALAKSDNPILRYQLLLLLEPRWASDEPSGFPHLAAQLPELAPEIEQMINFPQKNLIFRFVQRYSAVFLILYEILKTSDSASAVLSSPDSLGETAHLVAESKYQRVQRQISNAIVRSVIYIFITKVFLAILIELPYERYVLGEISYLPLAINIFFPIILMVIVGKSARIPGSDNTTRIISHLDNLLYEPVHETKPLPARLTLTPRQKRLGRYFSFFYTIVVILILLGVGSFLMSALNFNILNTILFFIFFSLVLLFGYRVRWESQELMVAKHSGGVIGHVANILAMPFINLGARLSAGLAQINIFMFILDIIIDAPLKSLVGAVEEWGEYLKRKEEEVVEVPTG